MSISHSTKSSNSGKSSNKVSIYAPFWDRLKQDKILSIRAPTNKFKSLIKAIKKRKDLDRRFKAMNIADPCKLQIIPQPDKGIVIFILKQTVGISDIIVPAAIDKIIESTINLEDI